MGKVKKVRKAKKKKFAEQKKVLSPKDSRMRKDENHVLMKDDGQATVAKKGGDEESKLVHKSKVSSSMFFEFNTNLVPPYLVLIDTNFVNFSIQHKLDVFETMMQCLLAKVIPCVTDCVVGELEKMGHRYRLALRLVKDPRFRRLTCTHRGTYADDCLVERISQHKCYIVATSDKDLKRRIRKIPGVPIMSVAGKKYSIERMPDAMTCMPTVGRVKS